MQKEKVLKKEFVFSKIEDKQIKSNLIGSPIWKECKHLADVTEDEQGFVYTIFFENLTPISVVEIKKYVR